MHAERLTTPVDKSRELQRKLYLMAKRQRVSVSDQMWLVEKDCVSKPLKAPRRRLSESRMRENLTYGSRWQGMETRIWW